MVTPQTRSGSLMWIRIVRIILGLLLPLPFFGFYLAWHAVNQSYHAATYDPSRYWLNASVVLVPIAVAGLFLAFWRSGSKTVGLYALGFELVALAVMTIWTAMIL